MMKLFFRFLIGAVLLFNFGSCTKVEGPGGSSSIIGKIHALVVDGAGNVLAEYDAPKEDVYIIYGSSLDQETGEQLITVYDDDVETSYDGRFRFEYLEKGNYQVFVYEKCIACPSGKEVIIIDVEISDKNSEIDLGTINIKQ